MKFGNVPKICRSLQKKNSEGRKAFQNVFETIYFFSVIYQKIHEFSKRAKNMSELEKKIPKVGKHLKMCSRRQR